MKRISPTAGFTLAVILTLPTSTFAEELHLCGKVYQDRPCDASAPTPRKVLSPNGAAANSKKRSLLHEVTMRSIEAKREYNIRVNLDEAERICRADNTTIEACESAIAKLEEILDRRVTAERQLSAEETAAAEQRRLAELQEEENRIQRERNQIELRRRNQNVVIIQNNQNLGENARPPVVMRQETTVVNGSTAITTRDPIVVRPQRPNLGVGVNVQIGR